MIQQSITNEEKLKNDTEIIVIIPVHLPVSISHVDLHLDRVQSWSHVHLSLESSYPLVVRRFGILLNTVNHYQLFWLLNDYLAMQIQSFLYLGHKGTLFHI